MTWKEKIEQLIGLLEKIPHPQVFDTNQGVYQPYFMLELRPANWEIIPNAEYTRLDGQPGKEIRLNLQAVETQKVNINQDELNLLAYLFSFSNYDNRRIFSYGQPVGFLLDWLRGSQLRFRSSENKEIRILKYYEEIGNISLGIFRDDGEYVLQPMIIFSEHTIVLESQIDVLTSNPIYLLYREVLYRVESQMPAFFWMNFFRVQPTIRIPSEELGEFISSFVSKILPALDWKNLQEHLKIHDLPLTATKVYLHERAGQFHPDVHFEYQQIEFPAHPPSEKSLASQNDLLFIVKREGEKENQTRKFLQQHGLLYIQHRWQVDPQYSILDWLRIQIPLLKNNNIIILGEEKLQRYKLKRGIPKLYFKINCQANWIQIQYQLRILKNSLNIPDFTEQMAKSKGYLKLSDGSHVYFDEDLLHRTSRFIEITNLTSSKGSEKIAPSAFPIIEELIKLADEVETDDQFGELQRRYEEFQNIQKVPLSDAFRGILRDYQQSGLDWLSFLYRFQFGGILADDMGLGKTIQVIALLLNLNQQKKLDNPVLVIVPLTVLFNWENEIKKFAPSLKVICYQGSRAERQKIARKFHQYNAVLLSYGILLQDHNILSKYPWCYLILDESQKIKNPNTKTYKAVKSLEIPHRLCLTGTPIENSLTDLWAQFNFLNPGMLGTLKQFESRFGKNGNYRTENHNIFKRLIHPFILRRTKEEVVDELPERTDIIHYVEMTENQQKVYQKWLNFFRQELFDHIEKNGLPKSRLKILEALTYLRQIACHPAILDPEVAFEDSGKVLLLEEMLDEILQEGHKVLVFSQFVRFLNLSRRLLDMRNWRYEYLDGKTRQRETVIKNFQENPNVKIFLISLKAGGLGLNLTAADYVIHLDPWWNPAVEQQATDRAHRIGQRNRVFVYKYIVKNSVEEKVLLLQNNKKKLFEEFIPSERSFIKKLSRDDLKYLFHH